MTTDESRMIFCQHDSTEFKRVFARTALVLTSSRNIILTQKAQKTQKASRYALAGRPDGDIRAIAMYESA